MPALLGFADILQLPELYTTRTLVTTASSGGSDTGSLPASNLFTKNIGKVYQREGLESGDTVRLDLDLIRRDVFSLTPMGIAIIGLLNVTLRDLDGILVNGFLVGVNANSSGFADAGGSNSVQINTPFYQTELSPRNVFFVVSVLDTAAMLAIGGRTNTGAVQVGRYLRFFITDFTGSNLNLQIGRIVVMPAIMGTTSSTSFRMPTDQVAKTQYAYNGTPYQDARQARRGVEFELVDQGGAQINSAGTITNLATVQNANYYAVGRDGVAYLPIVSASGQAVSDFSAYYGLLTGPLEPGLVKPAATQSAMVYTVGGAITEILP